MSQAATLAPEPISIPETEAGKFFEIVNGQFVEKPIMGNFQVVVSAVLDQILGGFVRANRLGRVVPEMLFRINPEGGPQRRPDVAFVSFERWPRDRKVDSSHGLDVIPDLAIEVISPSNTADEVFRKIREYFQAGVLRVWVVYTSVRQVHVFESPRKSIILGEGDELDGEHLLPGFRLALTELFEDGAEE